MQQLSRKQIKGLRSAVKHYVWVKWLLLFMPVFYWWAAGMYTYYAWRICKAWGYSFDQIFDVFDNKNMDQVYQGAQSVAAGHVLNAMLALGSSVFFLTLIWAGRRAHKNNKLLLYYIDKDQCGH